MIGRKCYGNGPLPCQVAIVGEGPGRVESETGLPFQGASGAELDWLYLRRAANLRREDVYVTNIVKWRTDEDDSDPTAADIARDEAELIQEIELCNPEIIVAVGKIAAQWFMQSDDIDMEKIVGVPIRCPRYQDRILLVVYHPAAGLHQPERYIHHIYWQFQQLGELVRKDSFNRWVDAVRFESPSGQHYGEAGADPLWAGTPALIALDTEGSLARPWGLSVSVEDHKAWVVRGIEDSPAKDQLRAALKSGQPLLHNALHDLPVLERLGVPIDASQVHDSMLAAYLLPQFPRRLKALSYKLLGVEQNEYEDIIKEADAQIAKGYLDAALDHRRCTDCSGTGHRRKRSKRDPERELKGTEVCQFCNGDGTLWKHPITGISDDDSFGQWAKRERTRAHGVGRRIRTVLQSGDRLRERWTQIDDALRQDVEGVIGPMPEVSLDDVPLDKAVHYSAADADCTLRVFNKLVPMLKKEGLWGVYAIDRGIIPIIDRMHRNGIRIDPDHFERLGNDFSTEQAILLDRLEQLCGLRVMPSSPTQTAELIYDHLGCKPLRGKRSTDEKTLETLKLKAKNNQTLSQAIDLVTEYRELDKLLGTYVRPLPVAADSNDRIHTRFLLHVTATGRLSSRDPNLQNIPTRTERGRLIRKGFIPREGCKLVSVDLDQIELRVAAHISQDEGMIDVFTTGKDIHRSTAALIYGIADLAVTTQQRLLAKTINFLILYGGGAGRLHSELSLLGITTTKDQCVGYINDWYRAYPRVREYIDSCHRAAKSDGYVSDLFGRRRYVQGVHSCIERTREESLKWATNFPIQSTAAGIMKLWMKRVWDSALPQLWKSGYYCEPLLTIHDEIVLECEVEGAQTAAELIMAEASRAGDFAVPISAKFAIGDNWAQLK